MDLHMPVCDGTTSIRSIRKYESDMGLGKTPIVVLSADNQDVSQTNALDVGADDFLLKPLDFDDVAKILSNFSNDDIEISA
jgi:CheY-like chemotaxis protein